MEIYYIIGFAVMAYLLGSIPSAVWIGKRFYGVDVREHGSKNAGATNTLRVLGKRAALPVFILDLLKGFVAVSLVGLIRFSDHYAQIDDNELIIIKIAIVFIAVLGHVFPIFAKFKGGKGVATLVGAVAGIYPPVVLMCFGVWLIVFVLTHYVSLSSMIGGACFPIFASMLTRTKGSTTFIVFAAIIAVLLIVTHRKNIKRLIDGTESKIYFGKQNQG